MYKPKNFFSPNASAGSCIHIARAARRQLAEHAGKFPIPATIGKYFSRKDLAFIAAAYAIPLPGTALFAACIVGTRHGYRNLRNRFNG